MDRTNDLSRGNRFEVKTVFVKLSPFWKQNCPCQRQKPLNRRSSRLKGARKNNLRGPVGRLQPSKVWQTITDNVFSINSDNAATSRQAKKAEQ